MSPTVGWIFGYGSLLWRPDFPYRERALACLPQHSRRFWQGSPDHRGRPDAPGRVVTLVGEACAECWGAAYRVEPDVMEGVLARLDARESGGFERSELEIALPGARRERALVYVARAGNPNFLGPAPLAAMVAQIRAATGRSGSNVDYVLRLASALHELERPDAHVLELAEGVASGDAMKVAG